MGTTESYEMTPKKLSKIEVTNPTEKKYGGTKTSSSYFLLDENMPDESFVVLGTHGSKTISFPVLIYKIRIEWFL